MGSTERKFTVYVHIVPNGKRYVGITCLSIAKRWGGGGVGYRTCPYFWNAIKKYGWDNIVHQIIAEGLTEAEAKQSEKELICIHRTREHLYGYNLTDGGDGTCGRRTSTETRALIGAALRGKPRPPFTAETREKMSIALKGKKNALGCKRTAERRAQTSEANRNRIMTDETREKLRARSTGNHYALGSKRTPESVERIRAAQRLLVKDVECLTMDGNIVGRYSSLTEAAEKTGINKSNIQRVCCGRGKSSKGFKWRYV